VVVGIQAKLTNDLDDEIEALNSNSAENAS